MKKAILQVALDLLELKRAVQIAKEAIFRRSGLD